MVVILIGARRMNYREENKMATRNDLFLDLVKMGMTKEDLETNIKRRPWIWEVYEGWLVVLPTENEKDHGI